MKRIIAWLTAALLVLCAVPALAEKTATALPGGVSFGMNMQELSALLGDQAARDVWYEDDPDAGTLMLEDCALGVGDLTADDLFYQVDRNNSQKTPRLSMITASLPVGENVIASFKAVVAAFTEAYGAPDSDPFDSFSVDDYVEYGTLSATWTKDDVRINLSMNRRYDESLSLDFSCRKNYDPADLQ